MEWEGVANSQYGTEPILTKTPISNQSSIIMFNDDMTVAVGGWGDQTSSSGNNATYGCIYFLNAQGGYSLYKVNVSEMENVPSGTTQLYFVGSTGRINEDGTLALWTRTTTGSSNYSCVIVEIDKTNQTAKGYYFDNAIQNPYYIGIRKHYIINTSYSSGYSNTVMCYNYDTEQHTFTRMTGTATGSNSTSTTSPTGRNFWLNSNTLVSGAGYTNRIYIFDDENNSVSYVDPSLPSPVHQSNWSASKYLDYAVCSNGENIYLYSIDSNFSWQLIGTRTYTEITGSTHYGTGIPTICGNKMLIVVSNSQTNLYDISNFDISVPTLLETYNQSISPNKQGGCVDIFKFFAGDGMYVMPKNSNAQYLAYEKGGTDVTANKVYGIVNKPLVAGQVDTAQMMFSTIGGGS